MTIVRQKYRQKWAASLAELSLPSLVKDGAGSYFFSGEGERVVRIESKDWSRTPLGPIESWPEALHTAVGIAINSKQPTCIAWGAELVAIYNDAYYAILGKDICGELGRPLREMWAEFWPFISHAVDAVLAGRHSFGEDIPVSLQRNGELENIFLTFSNTPIKDKNGTVTGIFSVCYETTHKAQGISQHNREAAEKVLHRNQVLADIVDYAAVGILQVDLDGHIRLANRNFCGMLGQTNADLIGRHLSDILFEDDQRPARRSWKQLLESSEPLLIESRYVRLDDSHIWTSNSVTLVKDGHGNALYAVLVISDITQRKGNEEHIRYLATHDPLTSLPNRTLLHDRLTHAIDKALRTRNQMGVLFLDLNRFKMVNDSLGHDIGDVLLQHIAGRLKDAVREGDTVARLGGDEFVIVLDQISDIANIASVATNVLRAISKPIQLAGHEISVSTSIGGCVYPRDGLDAVTLLKHADVAMYQAKEFGIGTFRFFNPEMNVAILDRLLSETGLLRALERQEFVLHYQPRFSLNTGEVVGAEALLRWLHPEKGLISPADFIPLAEEIGLISKIGEWVLREACRQNREWHQKGLSPFSVSVNVSGKQLQSSSFVKLLQGILTETGLEPKWLELEITETSLVADLLGVKKMLLEMRRLGVSVAIDDFGTGYSSLNYLRMLPINFLKIDRSFIAGIVNDKDDASIVSATIELAHKMSLSVVAEGVATREQLLFLAKCGCDQIQGFLSCPPLTSTDLESFLKTKPSIFDLV